jgi:hypothetical protein
MIILRNVIPALFYNYFDDYPRRRGAALLNSKRLLAWLSRRGQVSADDHACDAVPAFDARRARRADRESSDIDPSAAAESRSRTRCYKKALIAIASIPAHEHGAWTLTRSPSQEQGAGT